MEKIIKFVTPTNPEETAQFHKDLKTLSRPYGDRRMGSIEDIGYHIYSGGKDCIKMRGVTAQDFVDLRRSVTLH